MGLSVPNNTSFKKGKSGNPSGYTKEYSEMVSNLRNHLSKLSPRAIKLMEGVIAEMELGVRRVGREEIGLLNSILDRVIGKPAQTIINQIDEQQLANLPIDSLTRGEMELFMTGKLNEFLKVLHQKGLLAEYQQKFDAEVAPNTEEQKEPVVLTEPKAE